MKRFNPLSEIKSLLIKHFDQLGFQIEFGDEIVTLKENFKDLDIPEDHPSWSRSETFFIDQEFILRPHCTVNSIQFLKRLGEKSVACATIGTVYRKDDETPRHTHQFTQLDFIFTGKNLNLGNLKWIILEILKVLFGSGLKKSEYRFRNSYFPFTTPSYELDLRCSCKENQNCSFCKGSGWIEVMGAGMVKKKILDNAGFSDYQAIAGGLGLERVALIKYRIKDIRSLYENKILS